MNQKLVITKIERKIWTALFQDGEIVDLYCASASDVENDFALGNIYVGKVKNIVNNINAAFIEINDGVECYYSISENPTPFFTHKIGKKPLCVGDELLVQISKEATKTKVATVSSNLNFTGKYAVLTTGDTRVGVSSKIAKGNRESLIQTATPYASDEYGFIIRTNAKDANATTIETELKHLISEYKAITSVAKTRVCYSCLKHSEKQYLTKLRDIYQNGLMEILVEDEEIYNEVRTFLSKEQPEDLAYLTWYTDKQLPLHKLYRIEKHISDALKEVVWLKSGAYLVIQPTEALTVIDVNTGKCISKKKDETATLKINIEAAIEAAKQIRVRNLSGIIIIDFINLANETHMQELLEILRCELRKDPITTTLVDLTKLQLIEITRKKVRKPLHEAIRE